MIPRADSATLGRLGVTNERLDEVSDYYRYQPQRGQLWRTRSAKGYAPVEDGKAKQDDQHGPVA